MRPVRLLVGVALTVLLAVAADARAGAAKKKAAKPGGTRGVVTAVDTAGKTFTFRTGKKKDPDAKETTVSFSAATKFVRVSDAGSADVKAVDLVTGKRVAVVYEAKAGKNVASTVTILDRTKKKTK